MNVCLHERAQGVENHAMSLKRPATLKGLRDYRDLEVSTTVLGTSVPCMQVTLIFDLQPGGFEYLFKF